MQLLRMFERPTPPAARFPAGRVGFAVGDIHGRSDCLAEMFDLLEARAEQETREGAAPVVIFLGDYVDRGPDSRGVLDLLLSGRPHGFERRYLKGNHEQAMLGFLDDPMEHRAWLLQGGAETLLSYGIQPPPPVGAREHDWIGVSQHLRARMPPEHFEFLTGLERYVELGDYAFVHAGVDVSRPLEQQTDEDLFWIRAPFLSGKRPFTHRVVHGHTPVERPHADHRRIAVDTGAYVSGTLTAARFEGDQVEFVSATRRTRG
ncbi:MAG: serine/threonine protein phosphatase [Hyphomonadaceae bacterium]|nr:serine/threonine protein phosphatase [Hyphomonadaceae bacterium]GIK47604.1 MAG: metallophosphoesterase [Alphaproteobacteria bacterium]